MDTTDSSSPGTLGDPMLAEHPLVPHVVATDLARAKQFYGDTLGLKLRSDDGPLMFETAGGGTLLVYPRENPPVADHTVMGWFVTGIEGIVRELASKGVAFERYDGYDQNDLGIAQLGPGGPKAAWLKDPDGNILSITEVPRGD